MNIYYLADMRDAIHFVGSYMQYFDFGSPYHGARSGIGLIIVKLIGGILFNLSLLVFPINLRHIQSGLMDLSFVRLLNV